MPTRLYRNTKGEHVPGVTTIIGQNLGWSKDALMYWAWRQGVEGRDFRSSRDAAADIGTIAHAMVEAELRGTDWRTAVDLRHVTDEMIARAETAYSAWREWAETVNFKPVASELALVSDRYNFGGTLDIAAVKRVTSIVDLKTASAVHADHVIQLAAYGQLYTEHHPHDPVRAYYLLRLDRNTGGFAYHYWPAEALEPAWEAFLCLLKLHALKKQIA